MQKIKTKWDPIRIQVPERVRKEEDMKTNYENAYINLFRFLYEDKKDHHSTTIPIGLVGIPSFDMMVVMIFGVTSSSTSSLKKLKSRG